MGRAVVVLTVALLILLVATAPARAHARLTGTTPADQTVLDDAPTQVVFAFDQAATLVPGGITVVGPDGSAVALGVVTTSADGTIVTVPLLDPLAQGSHVATWRIVSEDGHPIGGSSVFSVGAPTPLPKAAPAAAASTALTTAVERNLRAFSYLAVLLLVGAIAFRRAESGDRTGQPLLVTTAAVVPWLALATLATEATLVRGLGPGALLDATTWRDVLATPVGRSAIALGAGGLVAGRWLDRGGRGTALLAGALMVAAPVAEGHTLTASPVWLTVTSDVVHLLAAAVWSGGLALLVVRLRSLGAEQVEATSRSVARFSGTAAVALLAVTVTGTTLSWVTVGGLAGLATPYGAALLAKIGLVGLVAGVGGWNRWRLVPRVRATRLVAVPAGGSDAAPERRSTSLLAPDDARAWRLLRRTLRAEVGLLVLVVAASATLVGLQPGRAAAEARLTTTVEQRDDEHTFRLAVRPALAGGVNRAEIGIRDVHGYPLHTEDFVVRLSHPASGIGPIERRPFGDHGFWRIEGTEFAVPGTWVVEVVARVDTFEEVRHRFEVEIAPR